MAMRLVSARVVSLTLSLAKEFRDMQPLKGERDLNATRVREHVQLLEADNFFVAAWRKMKYPATGEMLRGNGNHTSNLLTACIMLATTGKLDAKAQKFCESFVWGKGKGSLPKGQLPRVVDNQLKVLVEEYLGDDEADKHTFFRMSDALGSVRKAPDILNDVASSFAEFDGYERRKISRSLGGVLRTIKEFPTEYGYENKAAVILPSGSGGVSDLLWNNKVREVVKWIIDCVPYEIFYEKTAGAQVMAEICLEHGPDEGERIVQQMAKDYDNDVDPTDEWVTALTKKKNKATINNLIERGRKVVKAVRTRMHKPEDAEAEDAA